MACLRKGEKEREAQRKEREEQWLAREAERKERVGEKRQKEMAMKADEEQKADKTTFSVLETPMNLIIFTQNRNPRMKLSKRIAILTRMEESLRMKLSRRIAILKSILRFIR